MTNAKTICTVCNYIYDEEFGEPRQNIAPSLKFESLSEQWQCPECGSSKEMFQPCLCASLHSYGMTCVTLLESDINTGAADKNPENTVMKTMAVGRLVAQRPSRASLLEQLGIDYCCGGEVSLEDACSKMGLDVDEVVQKLISVDSKDRGSVEPSWNEAALSDLIDHIVDAYHKPLQPELARIKQLAEKVARVHGDSHPEMVRVLEIFNQFRLRLEVHMQKEEMVLFPGIKAMEATGTPQIFGCGGGIEHPVEVMTQEHDDAGESLNVMRRLTNGFAPPADACWTFKVLLYSLARLESEMHQHVHLENNILFPRALALRKLQPAIG